MKKLLTIAMITLATMVAKADLYLYWTVDVGEFTNAYVAQIYSGSERLGAMYVASGATDTNITGYTEYWVALYDAAKNEIAVSGVVSYSDVTSSVSDRSIVDNAPTSSPFTFGGFTATIPEPTSGLMLLLGLAGLALKRKLA